MVLWSVKAETAKDRLEVRNIVLDGFGQKKIGDIEKGTGDRL